MTVPNTRTSANAMLPSASWWTRFQYRILKRYFPGEPSGMDGSAYKGASKLQVLLGDDMLERMRNQDVLDFGCGTGQQAVEMAGVARSVYGLDIMERSLETARQHAIDSGVADRCTFSTQKPAKPVNFIISLDSFEHFDDPADILRQMYDLLQPGGQVLISFGPPWYHPLGGHLFSVFPWAHLLFSEEALLTWRTDFKSDGARRFREVEGGLNQITIGRFERLLRTTPFRVVQIEPVPIRRLRPISNALTREYTTAIVRCVLERPFGSA